MEESLPNITGEASAAGDSGFIYTRGVTSGALYKGKVQGPKGLTIAPSGSYQNIALDASLSSSTYQDNAHVRPLSIATTFLIRY